MRIEDFQNLYFGGVIINVNITITKSLDMQWESRWGISSADGMVITLAAGAVDVEDRVGAPCKAR